MDYSSSRYTLNLVLLFSSLYLLLFILCILLFYAAKKIIIYVVYNDFNFLQLFIIFTLKAINHLSRHKHNIYKNRKKQKKKKKEK